MTIKSKVIAEAFGTFWLVFAGCGAVVINDLNQGVIGYFGIAIIFGLIVMAMIYSIGNISGAHINPAVTLAFMFSGKLEKKNVIPYILSQLTGAILAAAMLKFLFPEHSNLGSTLPSIPIYKAFIIELLLSFLLMFVILNVSTGHQEKGIMAGAAIGGLIGLEALLGGVLTGASMNPARSIGPALISGNIEILWLYILAPIAGTLLAVPTCNWIQCGECCSAESKFSKSA